MQPMSAGALIRILEPAKLIATNLILLNVIDGMVARSLSKFGHKYKVSFKVWGDAGC